MNQAERTRQHTNDYRDWIANGTPEQKALWEIERKLHNKPEKKAEYMAVVNRLQTFLPPSPMGSNGKYSSGGGMETTYRISLVRYNRT